MMEIMIILAVMAINIAISWWNCYVVGSAWDFAKGESLWLRLLLWSAATQSAIGFSMPIMGVLLLLVLTFAGLSPSESQQLVEWAVSFWYVGVIIPLLGTGLLITIHSWAEAIRRRDLASIATAGWNTFAQVHNMMDAAQNLGPMMGEASKGLGEIFSALSSGGNSKDAAKGKAAILALLIAILAISLGIIITVMLINRYRKQAWANFRERAEVAA